jgi:hypothetical protein
MGIVKLYNENKLIADLQQDTIWMIKHCDTVDPVKKLVTCFDILKLTLDIGNKFPSIVPRMPECDEGALSHLLTLTRELTVYHHKELPNPDFIKYTHKIKRLLLIYGIPKG